MATTSITEMVYEGFLAVAPGNDARLRALDPDVDVWEALDLDSMDHLAVMEHLSRAIGRDVPESDYPHLLTLATIQRYVEASTGGSRY